MVYYLCFVDICLPPHIRLLDRITSLSVILYSILLHQYQLCVSVLRDGRTAPRDATLSHTQRRQTGERLDGEEGRERRKEISELKWVDNWSNKFLIKGSGNHLRESIWRSLTLLSSSSQLAVLSLIFDSGNQHQQIRPILHLFQDRQSSSFSSQSDLNAPDKISADGRGFESSCVNNVCFPSQVRVRVGI